MKLIDIFWKRIGFLDVFIKHFFGVVGVKMLNLQERDMDPHPIPDPH